MTELSLVARASAALDRLKRLDETARLANEGDRVRTRAEELERPAIEVEHVALVVDALRGRGIAIELPESSVFSMREQLAALRDRYRTDPSQITAADGRLRFSLWDPLRVMPAELRGLVLAAWRSHARGLIREQSVELLDVLEHVPGLQADARAIRQLATEFDRLSESLPQDEAGIDHLEGIAKEIERRWQSLEGGGIPREVVDFLAAAALSGAPLDLLTPAVREWLDERSLTRYVRLSMSGADR
jgi:hypothetical protein